MKHKKIDFHFNEETIERIAEHAAIRIEEEIDKRIKDAISYRLLDEDTVNNITDAIRNLDNPNIGKIEICVHTARGQLYSAVKKSTLEKALLIISSQLKIINDNEATQT